jgi:hypothetical protein
VVKVHAAVGRYVSFQQHAVAAPMMRFASHMPCAVRIGAHTASASRSCKMSRWYACSIGIEQHCHNGYGFNFLVGYRHVPRGPHKAPYDAVPMS